MITRQEWLKALKASEQKWTSILKGDVLLSEYNTKCACCTRTEDAEGYIECEICALKVNGVGCFELEGPWEQINQTYGWFFDEDLSNNSNLHAKHLDDIKQMLANIKAVRKKYEAA